jgi:hypothetical protein
MVEFRPERPYLFRMRIKRRYPERLRRIEAELIEIAAGLRAVRDYAQALVHEPNASSASRM